MKRCLSFLLVCLLSFSVLSAFAATANINPSPEWWGMSRSAFKNAYNTYPFEEIDAGEQKALLLKGGKAGEYTLDMYFYFGEKPAGKSYYGLSDVVYLVPVEEKKFSNSALKKMYNGLADIISETNGQPVKSASTQSQWELPYYSITVGIDSFKDFNGSDFDTVAVIFSMPASEETSEPTAKPTATPKASSSSSGKGSTVLQVSADAKCSDTNHVGEKWKQEYKVNGQKVTDNKTVTLKAGDEITVYAKITEEDSNPDMGEASKTYVVTRDDLSKGFKVTFNVAVEENGGRYKGSKATWRVTFAFKP